VGNPARELLEILDSWNVPRGKTIYQVRRADGQNGAGNELWDAVLPAMRCLLTIDGLLDQLDDQGIPTEHYRINRPVWYEAVLRSRNDWAQSQSAGIQLVSPSERSSLMMFAEVLDARGLGSLLTGDTLDKLASLLAEAEDAALNVEGLSDETRARLTWHIQQARTFAGNIARFGEAATVHAAQAVAADLVGIIQDEASEVPEADRERLRSMWRDIFVATVGQVTGTGILAGLPLALGAAGLA